MNTSTLATPVTSEPLQLGPAARIALGLLQQLPYGRLMLTLPDGSVREFGSGLRHPGTPGMPTTASMQVHDLRLFERVLSSGDIGLAESYIAREWSCPDLSALLTLLMANREHMETLVYGSWAGRLIYRLKHLLHRNTRSNSRKNIHAHYDLGNEFYRLWLDPSMNYSAAWFEDQPAQSLTQAQNAKVRRALRLAGVQPGHRVLEIGCGWGALAEMATVEFGAALTGVTLSSEQLAYANQRMERLGVSCGKAGQADLRLQDYRDIQDAPFDAICSIEMVEAVGREYWPNYFASVSRLLKSGGRACIQSIVIDDRLFERYLGSTDFIQQYIFPGGCLPSPSEFRRQAQAAGLEVVDELFFGQDYAETLRRWHVSFKAKLEDVTALGFDQRFQSIWEFYLAYCEAAFVARNIDVVQFTLRKP